MLLDRLDQKEREEYYETPRIHGVSTNDIRFMEADKLSTYTLVIMYIATAIAGVYALCTLGLLIGAFIDLSFITLPCESVIHRFFLSIRMLRYNETSLRTHAAVASVPFDCVHFEWNGFACDVFASQSILGQCHW